MHGRANAKPLSRRAQYEADPLEIKIRKMLNREERIVGVGNLFYSDEYKQETDIRTDRWETAREAIEKAHGARQEADYSVGVRVKSRRNN